MNTHSQRLEGDPARTALVAMALDALDLARMFRKHGDTQAARIFLAFSAGYMARSKQGRANG
jgi:hypothetical protein